MKDLLLKRLELALIEHEIATIQYMRSGSLSIHDLEKKRKKIAQDIYDTFAQLEPKNEYDII